MLVDGVALWLLPLLCSVILLFAYNFLFRLFSNEYQQGHSGKGTPYMGLRSGRNMWQSL